MAVQNKADIQDVRPDAGSGAGSGTGPNAGPDARAESKTESRPGSAKGACANAGSDALAVELRAKLRRKMEDYSQYDLSPKESGALNIFFDLTQEYMNLAYIYPLAVEILDLVFNIPAELYTKGEGESFVLRTACIHDDEWDIQPEDFEGGNFGAKGRICLAVRGRYREDDPKKSLEKRDIRGALVLYPKDILSRHELLFLEKFANRIGFALHNHLLTKKDKDHIEFVRNLVKDVGHNVLGPNMYFKLLLNKLEHSILDVGDTTQGYLPPESEAWEAIKGKHNHILELLDEVQQHFSHSSLFLESLLRESHFLQGRYVLRNNCMDLYERVVLPQYQRFTSLFEVKNIKTELIRAIPEIPPVEADFGLISQVVSNFFSNALKYAAADPANPEAQPFMRCSVSLENERAWPDSGEERPGVRVDVLTSGKRIPPDEAAHLFEKYFRGSNTMEIPGSGKGLHFVGTIVEQHHGDAGYRSTEEGNLFYFILPVADCRVAGGNHA